MRQWLLVVGFVSILGQVVLLRELNVAFFGSELIYILALGVWLLWTASGAMIGRHRPLPSITSVRVMLVGCGLIVPLSVVLIRGSRILFGGVPGAYLPFPRQILAMAVALLPLGLLLGLLFQRAARLYIAGRRSLARAYAIESAGGLLGGGLATLFLKWGVQNFAAALLCGMVALVSASWPWWASRPRWLALLAISLLGILALGLQWSAALDFRFTRWDHPQVVESRDTPYSRVTVTRTAGQISVFENDELAFESEGTAAEEFVHLAALQHPDPDSVLVLGGGVEGLVKEVLQHHPEHVDYVDLNGDLVALLSRYLPPDIQASLAAGPVRVHIADPRRFLHGSLRGGPRRAMPPGSRYDLILVGMPEPTSGQANRYYTREFFRECRRNLRPGGVLAFRLRAAENFWTPQLVRRTASIEHALRDVFDSVVVLPGVTNIVIASPQPLPDDPALLAERLERRGIQARLVSAAYIHYLYTNDRYFQIRDLLAAARVPANRDSRPICYQATLLIWLSRFFPVVAWLELPELGFVHVLRSPVTWAAVLGAGALLFLVRRRPASRSAALVGTAGFVGMVTETALILGYQTRSGVLYQDLGLLLTLFMGGLSLGALAVERLAGDSRGDLEAGNAPGAGRLGRRWGAAVLAVFAVLDLTAAHLLTTGSAGGLLETGLLLMVCGFLVAAAFAYAGLHGRPDQGAVVSRLYAADLLGGCLGSLGASLLLIPLAGPAGAAGLMIPLVLGASWLL